MPRNLTVIDTIPKNLGVEDVLPKNNRVEDVLSKNLGVDPDTTTRSYQVVTGAGQYMGLPFLMTYRDTGTMTQWSESGGVF